MMKTFKAYIGESISMMKNIVNLDTLISKSKEDWGVVIVGIEGTEPDIFSKDIQKKFDKNNLNVLVISETITIDTNYPVFVKKLVNQLPTDSKKILIYLNFSEDFENELETSETQYLGELSRDLSKDLPKVKGVDYFLEVRE